MFQRLLGAVLALLVAVPACAKDDGTDPSLTILADIVHVVVQRDGSFVADIEKRTRIDAERAVQSESQRSFGFNRQLEDVEVLEAYTEKPDGRRVPVSADSIKVQQEPASRGAPMFQDMQVKTLIYPQVGLHDVIYSHVRYKRSKGLFPNHYFQTWYPYFFPTERFAITIDMPQHMQLHVENVGFAATDPVTREGRTVYHWEDRKAENPRIESGAVAYWDFGRHLSVSTFDSYAQLAAAYDSAAEPAAAVTPAIERLARQLTDGLADPRAKALAIGEWVRKNIRYVAIYIGNGGVVPHPADTVLANRYGDCKDHAALMEALLRAAGIESTPVLIAANRSYRIAPVASLGQFNHAITYIPALDLFIDATADSLKAGYLGESELGKEVLLTRSGTLVRTPLTQPGTVRNRYQVRIGEDGRASFTFTRTNTGWIDGAVRHDHRNWKQADRDRFVENVLKDMGMKGSGSVQLGALDDEGTDYSYTLRGEAEDFTFLPGTIGIAAASSLNAGLAPQVFALTAEATRTQPFLCPAHDLAEDAEYALPAGARLLALPAPLTIDSPYFHYRASYRQDGNKVAISRSFRSGKQDSRVCTPQDFAAMQADIRRMVHDLRSQFIVELKAPAAGAMQ